MSWFTKVFGGGSSHEGPVAEDYNGFQIYVEPLKDGTKYRIAARIERVVEDKIMVHHLIRADTLESYDATVEASRLKAQQVIDEQGMRLFG